MMTVVAWTLVVVLAGLSAVLWSRGSAGGAEASLRSLADELRAGELSRRPATDEPDEVVELRKIIAERWRPAGSERRAAGDEALERIAHYLRNVVVAPLDEARAGGGDLQEAVGGALDALADLEFFAAGREEEARSDSLTQVLQEVTREFALEYSVTVKLRGPERPVRARFPRESLKDVIYLLLVNAARFGSDHAVEVIVEEDREPRLRVLDRGRGFTEESLAKATEPFYTTEGDSLGLGLTYARQVVEGFGGGLRLANREAGGAEVEVRLPRA